MCACWRRDVLAVHPTASAQAATVAFARVAHSELIYVAADLCNTIVHINGRSNPVQKKGSSSLEYNHEFFDTSCYLVDVSQSIDVSLFGARPQSTTSKHFDFHGEIHMY